MYCIFNTKVFNEFISKGKKIKPQLSDDWEILPNRGTKLDTITLKSKKLNQIVTDINYYNFLIFLKDYNITTEGLLLKGNFIIGNESPGMRKVYTYDMYQDYLKKFETKEKFNIKDLIPGSEIELLCGSVGIYMGSCYRVDLKKPKKLYVIRSKKSLDFQYVEGKSIKSQNKKVLNDLETRQNFLFAMITKYNYNKELLYLENKNDKHITVDLSKFDTETIKNKYLAKFYDSYSDNSYKIIHKREWQDTVSIKDVVSIYHNYLTYDKYDTFYHKTNRLTHDFEYEIGSKNLDEFLEIGVPNLLTEKGDN